MSVNPESSNPEQDTRPVCRRRTPLERLLGRAASPQALLRRTVATMRSSIEQTINEEGYAPFYDDDEHDYRAKRLARTQVLIDLYGDPESDVVTVLHDLICDILLRLDEEGEDVGETLASVLINHAEESTPAPIEQ